VVGETTAGGLAPPDVAPAGSRVQLEIAPGFAVLAIRREGRYVYRPRGLAQLHGGDELIATGPDEGRARLAELAGWRLIDEDEEAGGEAPLPAPSEVVLVVNSLESSLSVVPVDAPGSAYEVELGGTTPTPVGVSALGAFAVVPMGVDHAATVIDLSAGSVSRVVPLAAGGGKYLMCMPLRRGDVLTEQVLARAGRYRTVTERLQIKEVVIGEGERRLRYVLCFNPEEATRQQAHRRHLLEHVQAELAAMGDAAKDVQSKRVAALRSSSRWGKYLKLDDDKGLQLDAKAIKAAEHYDGKFVVHGNDDTLSAEDMALGYKQMIRVEQAWRDMKSTLDMRPVFHWAAHRIHAHVAITVLSLLLERTVEHACADSWRNVSDRLRRIQLAQLSSPHGTVWQVTDPTPEAAKCLKSLQIKPPPPVLQLA